MEDSVPSPGQLLDKSAVNDVFPEPTGSIRPHILLYAAQFVALASPRFQGRRYLVMGVLLGLFVRTQLQGHFSNDIGQIQPFAIQWSFLLPSLYRFWAAGDREGPEARFWRTRPGAADESEAERYPAFGLRKLQWAVMLMLSQRGVGWNHRVKNVPPPPGGEAGMTSTKSVFLRRQLLQVIKNVLLADLFLQLTRRFFYTSPETGVVGDVNTKYITMDYACPGWKFSTVFVFGAAPYFVLSAQYGLISFFSVLLGLGTPEDWPPMFSPIKEATTVRNFWGKFWHQLIRYPLTSWAGALVDSLGIRRGTNLSSYTQLWFVFIVSGYFHASSHLLFPSPVNITAAERIYPVFYFFVLQAAAITFEDLVKWTWCEGMGRGHHENAGRRVAGYAWVVVWLTYSLKYPALAFVKTRVGVESPLPFTVFEQWVTRIPLPF